MDRYAVTSVNYMAAVTVSLIVIALEGVPARLDMASFAAFYSEFGGVMAGGRFSPSGSVGWALMSGLPAGVFYYLGFIYLQKSIRGCGVSLSGSFSKMGILVPMALSLVIWREVPAPVQWVGILLALTAILVSSVRFRPANDGSSGFRPVLLLLFLTVGMAEFSNKVYQNYGVTGMKNLFLLAVFVMALSLSGFRTLRMKVRISRVHVVTGLAVGIPNYFASFFLIAALSRMSAVVVFPVYGALTICLISILGRVIFKERLRLREQVAVALAALSMVLVNLNGSAA